MHIGLVIYGSLDTLSGGYLYDRKLVEYLRKQGDTVEVISLPWRNHAAHLSDNLHFRLPGKFDLIIQDELNHPSLLAANARARRYPVVSLVHHLRCSEPHARWLNRLYRAIEKRYLHSVDAFIFNSKTTQHVVNQLAANHKPFVIGYPPTDRFGSPMSASEIQARAWQPGALRIVFLGNIIPRKNLDVLVAALQLQANPQHFHLDVVGSTEFAPAYASAILHAAGDQPNPVRFKVHGSLDNQELSGILRQAHVLVVPSAYEGFGIVYLEGMAFGLPAIGTTAGAAHESIRHGWNGYLIAPGDAHSLASHLANLAENRDHLAELSVHALQRYQQQPTWYQTAHHIRTFLQGLLT